MAQKTKAQLSLHIQSKGNAEGTDTAGAVSGSVIMVLLKKFFYYSVFKIYYLLFLSLGNSFKTLCHQENENVGVTLRHRDRLSALSVVP